MNLGVLASHEGTTLQSLLDAFAAGRIPGRVSVVVSNNSGSGALVKARQAGVQAVHLSSSTHRDPAALDTAIRDVLVTAAVDIVFLAGYMKKLGPVVLSTFQGRILNTHPALLPQFGGHGMYGDRAFEAVLEAGEAESGVLPPLPRARDGALRGSWGKKKKRFKGSASSAWQSSARASSQAMPTPRYAAWLERLIPGPFGTIEQDDIGRAFVAEFIRGRAPSGVVHLDNAAMRQRSRGLR